mmetsp:Transcript_11500/g.21503  ORF Transcript_11500/g.21503 Transcript_11500/m.21503 type:complete len:351 (+) Transcript_11500:97-1149(+)
MLRQIINTAILVLLNLLNLIVATKGLTVGHYGDWHHRPTTFLPYHRDAISHAYNRWLTTTIIGISLNFLAPVPTLAASEIAYPSSSSSSHHAAMNSSNDPTSSTVQVWHLPNGDVELPQTISNFKSFALKNPVLLGSGGGGSVFSTDAHDGTSSKQIAIKVSWVRSADSVKNECKVLQTLEEKQTRNIERCLGVETYPQDARRIVIALEPVIDDAVGNITGETSQEIQEQVVQSMIRTMVDMLVANIVTTDVQVLISRETGSVLFIDMTEAKEMSDPPTFLDLALASSFVSEIVSMIPETLRSMASKTLLEELIQTDKKGIHLSREIYDILGAYDILMSSEVAEYIKSRH